MAQPAHKIRIGSLSVVIWRNTSIDKGTTWYSVNASRSYKNGDDQWKETDSLSFDDLLTMGKLLDQAHSWIAKQMQADAKERKARQEAAGGNS
jgi:predicted esterase